MALALIAKGQQGRAQRLLESKGLANLSDPEILQLLESKHPNRRRELPSAPELDEMQLEPLEVKLETKYLSLPTLAGTGPSGYRNEYLISLAHLFEDSRARTVLRCHERFAGEYINGRLPAWFSYLWATVRLVAPIKQTAGDCVLDVRPIGIGEPRRVSCVSQVMDDWKTRFADRLWPHQVAIGIESGVHALGLGLRMALEQHPGWVLLKLDLVNAFNEMARAAVLESIESDFDGEFADLLPLFRTSLAFKSMIVLGDRAKTQAAFDSEEGMQQGSGEGPAGFCLGLHRDLVDADQQLAPHGGCAKADMDDTYLLGPIEQVLPAAIRFADRLEERTGIRLNLGKSALHSLNPGRDLQTLSSDPLYAEAFKVGRLDCVDPLVDPYGSGYGLVACGVPIGDETFVRSFVDSKVDAALEQIQKSTDMLRGVHHQSAWVQNLVCLRPKMGFIAQTCHGRHVDAALRRFDRAILAAAGASACLPLEQLSGRAARRLSLPARLLGCGLRKTAELAPAAFAGTICRVGPMLVDRDANGSTRAGFLHAQLEPVFGAGSFDEGQEQHRFDGLLRSGCTIGRVLESCWQTLVTAHADASNGTGPQEGPFSVTASAAGTDGSKAFRKPQHAFTESLELAWYDQLDIQYKALSRTDAARQAWLNLDRFSTQWVRAIPSPTLGWVLGNDVFSEVVATYLALPSPACAPLVGQRIGRHRDVLDPLGVKLETLALPGDGWRVRHDELKYLIDKDVRGHGVACTCEVFGLFAALLPQGARSELLAAPQRKRQGLVPDYLVTLPQGLESLMELKVIGRGPSHYASGDVSRCHAVAARAQAIPTEYRRKALRLDHQLCHSSGGVPGPISRKLAGYGRIWGLAFGAYGEASPDVHELLSMLAATYASRHWVRLRAQDPEDATAALSRALYRSWGLMAVRVHARLKLAGLAQVGAGAAAASSRRHGAEASHARRREAYQLQFAAGRAGRRRH